MTISEGSLLRGSTMKMKEEEEPKKKREGLRV